MSLTQLNVYYVLQQSRLCHSKLSQIRGFPDYVPKDVESKWQVIWKDNPVAKLAEDDTREKFYVLSMFPNPSGLLHMGHVRVCAISDMLAHYHRMRGKKVIESSTALLACLLYRVGASSDGMDLIWSTC